jgi:hypothetical protein
MASNMGVQISNVLEKNQKARAWNLEPSCGSGKGDYEGRFLIPRCTLRAGSPLRKPSSLTDFLWFDRLDFCLTPILLESAHWNGLHVAPER